MAHDSYYFAKELRKYFPTRSVIKVETPTNAVEFTVNIEGAFCTNKYFIRTRLNFFLFDFYAKIGHTVHGYSHCPSEFVYVADKLLCQTFKYPYTVALTTQSFQSEIQKTAAMYKISCTDLLKAIIGEADLLRIQADPLKYIDNGCPDGEWNYYMAPLIQDYAKTLVG